MIQIRSTSSTTKTNHRVPWGIRDIAAGIVSSICLITVFGMVAVALIDLEQGDEWRAGATAIIAVAVALLGIGITKIARAPLSITVNCLIWCSLAIAAAHLAASFIGDGSMEAATTAAVLIIVGDVALIAVAWTFTKGKYRASFADLRLKIPSRPLGALSKGIFVWIVALVLMVIWGWVVDAIGSEVLVPPDNTTNLLDELGGMSLLALFVVSIAAPVAEEIFFRSFLLAGVMKRFGAIIATILSSALFAAVHMSPGIGIGIIVPIFILGMALAVIYLWTRSVWICIIVHGLHNAFALIATNALDRTFAG